MLTSLLLEIPPAKLIRLLSLVETGKYQGREPHPIEPWLCRLARPRSSELTSCCQRGYQPCVLPAPSLQLSRDRADKPNRD